ncbi:hypothetical protein AAIH25_14305, partial [Arthrobacter crystallopoietes]|uniref:hypothetical protein n=1 Tax=Crystallibacter crystallopoietes TaxID=37928 RepID=UPI003D20A5FE
AATAPVSGALPLRPTLIAALTTPALGPLVTTTVTALTAFATGPLVTTTVTALTAFATGPLVTTTVTTLTTRTAIGVLEARLESLAATAPVSGALPLRPTLIAALTTPALGAVVVARAFAVLAARAPLVEAAFLAAFAIAP